MGRRGWLMGCVAFVAGSAAAAEPAPRRRRPVPRVRTSAASPTRGAAPAIDPALAPARGGLEPAPVPSRDLQAPGRDRAVGTTVDFGVPAPREPQQGQSFRGGQGGVEGRTEGGESLRIPAPGATVRVPF